MGRDQEAAAAQPCGELVPCASFALLPRLRADRAPQRCIDRVKREIDVSGSGKTREIEDLDRAQLLWWQPDLESKYRLRKRVLVRAHAYPPAGAVAHRPDFGLGRMVEECWNARIRNCGCRQALYSAKQVCKGGLARIVLSADRQAQRAFEALLHAHERAHGGKQSRSGRKRSLQLASRQLQLGDDPACKRVVRHAGHECPVSEVRDPPSAHPDTNFGNKGALATL